MFDMTYDGYTSFIHWLINGLIFQIICAFPHSGWISRPFLGKKIEPWMHLFFRKNKSLSPLRLKENISTKEPKIQVYPIKMSSYSGFLGKGPWPINVAKLLKIQPKPKPLVYPNRPTSSMGENNYITLSLEMLHITIYNICKAPFTPLVNRLR